MGDCRWHRCLCEPLRERVTYNAAASYRSNDGGYLPLIIGSCTQQYLAISRHASSRGGLLFTDQDRLGRFTELCGRLGTLRPGRRGMRPRVKLPFHRDGKHLATGDREQIPCCEQAESTEAESRVWVMRSAFQFDWLSNCRALPLRRFIGCWVDWMRHVRARSFEHAHEIVN